MTATRHPLVVGTFLCARSEHHHAVRIPGHTGALNHYLIDGRYTVAARHALDALEIAGRILPDDDNDEQASLAS